MSRRREGITACPENCRVSHVSFEKLLKDIPGLTPLIMRPKLRGNRIHRGPAEVGIGWWREPGLWRWMDPSAMITIKRVKVEMMPMREVMERKRRGTKVVGTILRARTNQVKACSRFQDWFSLSRLDSHKEEHDFEYGGRDGREQRLHAVREQDDQGDAERAELENDYSAERSGHVPRSSGHHHSHMA